MWGKAALFVGIAVVLAGCPKGKTDFKMAHKAEGLQDYDAAFEYYQKVLKTDPENADYEIKFDQRCPTRSFFLSLWFSL